MKLYIDEAWRWPLAWPMHIWIIQRIKNFDKNQFQDSKKLTEKQREILFTEIEELKNEWKINFAIWSVTNTEIDKLWVTKALNLAIRRWISQILWNTKKAWTTKNQITKWEKENHDKIELIIDWNKTFWLDKDLEIKVETIIKWDDKIKEISMASIIAKVSRDRIMENEIDKKYPKYNFKKHIKQFYLLHMIAIFEKLLIKWLEWEMDNSYTEMKNNILL